MQLIHAEEALLPEGWARDVTIRIEGGKIASVLPGTAAGAEAVRVAVSCRRR